MSYYNNFAPNLSSNDCINYNCTGAAFGCQYGFSKRIGAYWVPEPYNTLGCVPCNPRAKCTPFTDPSLVQDFRIPILVANRVPPIAVVLGVPPPIFPAATPIPPVIVPAVPVVPSRVNPAAIIAPSLAVTASETATATATATATPPPAPFIPAPPGLALTPGLPQFPGTTIGPLGAPEPVAIPAPIRNIDINLSVPWGMIIQDDIIWVNNAGSGLITSYDLLGTPQPEIINVFGPDGNIMTPTGLVYNPDFDAFVIYNGPLEGSASLILVTEDGTIHAFSLIVDPINTIQVVNNTGRNAVYKGCAILFNTLFAADFFNRRIDVFDRTFNRIDGANFIDEYTTDPIPGDYAPFNITRIQDVLFVCYARQRPQRNQFVLTGAGFGFVSVFDSTGLFLRRFHSRGTLNAPWGIVQAPSVYGYPANSILIGNFGDSTIGVFSECGDCIGKISDATGLPISINGLRALVRNPLNFDMLYWNANIVRNDVSAIGTITIRPPPPPLFGLRGVPYGGPCGF